MKNKIHLYQEDLPDGFVCEGSVAIDTEAMGLNFCRDRLCLVQLSTGDGECHIVQFKVGSTYEAPNLKALLTDKNILKIFHFARFDVGILYKYLGVMCAPIYCTKIVSKLVRTYTDRHGLKELCKTLISVDISKQEQTSDWGSEELTKDQLVYAAGDVLHLHALKEKLDQILQREGRKDLAEACFEFLPTRALLDVKGWGDDLLSHS